MDFKGKTAVITGGASGIGLAVAKALAAKGAKLVLADIEDGALQTALAGLRASGAEAEGLITDVSDRAAVERLADFADEKFGKTHIAFHNAGVAVFGPIEKMTDKDWEWTLKVNLWGPIHGVEAFLPRMLAHGEESHMVFTASFAGLVSNRHLAVYNVSKAAVVALAESLYIDMRGRSVGSSVLCPMRVESRIDYAGRNRPAELGGPDLNRGYSDDEFDDLQGRTIGADQVAQRVLDAIRARRLYIHTHAEAEPFFRKRADRVLAAFEALG
ncbi:MAG: SDR family NAD(P)-dependent oxidoreductase [Alphaproteobacteria bacterium]